MTELTRVAVYGTLRKGCHNNFLLQNQVHLGTFESFSPLGLHVSGCLPFVINVPETSNRLVYDMYEVDKKCLESLDNLEGHPNWYQRVQVPTPKGKAWMYLMHVQKDNIKDYTLISSGDWRESRQGAKRAP